MKKFLLICLLLLLVIPVSNASAMSHSKNKIMNVAHRGASGYAPENTLAAYDKAVEMNADYFEIDLQMTRDGQLVSIHDNTVDRTSDGVGFISTLSLSELKQLDAGSWFNTAFQNERIPTFDEILTRYRNKPIGILIEIKSPELYPGIEQQIAKKLQAYGLANGNRNKIIIQSFNHQSVQRSKALLPSIKHGVLISDNSSETSLGHMQQFKAYADYYNPSYKLITPQLVQNAHTTGLKVFPYTVRNQQQIEPLINAGVDGIITDYPDFGYLYGKKVKFK